MRRGVEDGVAAGRAPGSPWGAGQWQPELEQAPDEVRGLGPSLVPKARRDARLAPGGHRRPVEARTPELLLSGCGRAGAGVGGQWNRGPAAPRHPCWEPPQPPAEEAHGPF